MKSCAFAARAAAQAANYNGNLSRFGYADPDVPMRITIYPNDFDSKNEVIRLLDAYNEGREGIINLYEKRMSAYTYNWQNKANYR